MHHELKLAELKPQPESTETEPEATFLNIQNLLPKPGFSSEAYEPEVPRAAAAKRRESVRDDPHSVGDRPLPQITTRTPA